MSEQTTEPRDPAALVVAALDHLRERLPELMARTTVTGRPNRVPRAALDYLAAGLLCDFEMVPDETWWRDYFLVTGDHMVLTDYGWEHGSVKDSYDDDDIYDEVNAPAASSPVEGDRQP